MSVEAGQRSSFFLLRDQIEREIAKGILSFGEKNKLRDACEYALLSGGKRLRPIIVMMVAEALGFDLNVKPAALAVEYMHTASLIADDLPCMDNGDERREKPSLHRAYGESTALLSSYSLLFAGYGKIQENAEEMRKASPPFSRMADNVCCLCLKEASHLGGILGATGGQYLDLTPPNQSIEMVKKILHRKTVTLFQVSFLFGWLFGGGMVVRLEDVKRLAYHFGIAFQIADDLGDVVQDEMGQGEINIASVLEPKRAYEMFKREMGRYDELLKELGLRTASFEKMNQILTKSASAYANRLSS